MASRVKSPAQVEAIRRASVVVRSTLKLVEQMAAPGVRLIDLDKAAERFIYDAGGLPANKGYKGYPATLCLCIDDVAAHGIPSEQELPDGCVLTIDTGVQLRGWFSDAAITVPVGNPDQGDLLVGTALALQAGIAQARAGNRVCEIGRAIHKEALRYGLTPVEDFMGHGIGRTYHEKPLVANYDDGDPTVLEAGMVLAIEPILTEGNGAVVFEADGWTARTVDGTRVAQFEHVVLVTDGPAEILTA